MAQNDLGELYKMYKVVNPVPPKASVFMNIKDLLSERGLKTFTSSSRTIGSILEDALFCFKMIYNVPYPVKSSCYSYSLPKKSSSELPRLYHGIAHVSRVAHYIPVLANLYRRHNILNSNLVNDKLIYQLQVAALFHDAARMDDNEDLWDKESAFMCFHYFIQLYKNRELATMMAECIANKDYEVGNEYHVLQVDHKNLSVCTWVSEKTNRSKSILQQLLHDADCFDIIRARPHFEARYLDFYKEKASLDACAFEEMALLITEIRSLICFCGDQYERQIIEIKRNYHSPNCYELIQTKLEEIPGLLRILHAEGKIIKDVAVLVDSINIFMEFRRSSSGLNTFLPLTLQKESYADPEYSSAAAISVPPAVLTSQSLHYLMQQGKILFRGIGTPTQLIIKKGWPEETAAELELRKAGRRLGVPTRSSKQNNCEKDGNPLRSVSIIGWGGAIYTPVGYLVIEPDMTQFTSLSPVDLGSGYAKKSILTPKLLAETAVLESDGLIRQLKMGGSSCGGGNNLLTHTEALYHIKKFDAVCFTQDPTAYNSYVYQNSFSFTKHSPLLQAIYLQQLYFQKIGALLPLVDYSANHNSIRLLSTPSDESIMQLWVEAAQQTVDKIIPKIKDHIASLAIKKDMNFLNLDLLNNIEFFKVMSIYGSVETRKVAVINRQFNNIVSPDFLYSIALKSKLNTQLTKLLRAALVPIFPLILKAIKQNPSLLSNTTITPLILYMIKNNRDFLQEACIVKAISQIQLSSLLEVEWWNGPPLVPFSVDYKSFTVSSGGLYLYFLIQQNNIEKLSLAAKLINQHITQLELEREFSNPNAKLSCLAYFSWLLNNERDLERCKKLFMRYKENEIQRSLIIDEGLNTFYP